MKKSNFIIALIMCAIMILAVPQQIFAAEGSTASLLVNPFTVQRGDEITVTLSIEGEQDFACFLFQLYYDDALMECVAIEEAEEFRAARNTMDSSMDANKDNCIIMFVSVYDVSYSGPLAHVTFKMKNNCSLGTFSVAVSTVGSQNFGNEKGEFLLIRSKGMSGIVIPDDLLIADPAYSGLHFYQGNWFYVVNGVIDTGKTGLVHYDGAWFYVRNGAVDIYTQDFVEYDGGTFYVSGGYVCTYYSGLLNVGGKWYFLSNGQLQKNYNDLALYDNEWFLIENGRLREDYNGFYMYNGERFLVAAGRLQMSYSGLYLHADGMWYYIANGQLSNYTGLVMYDGAWFYVKNGMLDTSYTGYVEYDGNSFYVENGMLAM